jgi:hypothetical protein
VVELFRDWLAPHHPLKEDNAMSPVRQMRGGKEYDSELRTRMKANITPPRDVGMPVVGA